MSTVAANEDDPVPARPQDGVTASAVVAMAALAGCKPEQVRRYLDLKLIEPAWLNDGGVTVIRLIESLEYGGLSADQMAKAVAAGIFSFSFALNMMAAPAAMSTRTYAEVLAELDLDTEHATAMFSAAGLPYLDLARTARQEDERLLEIVKAVDAGGLSRRAQRRIMRVYGSSLRRIVEAQRDLFRYEVELPLSEKNLPLQALLMETAARRKSLQAAGFEVSNLLFRRMLEELVFENVAIRLHAGLSALDFVPAQHAHVQAIAFADMSGYTDYVRRAGDAAAMELSTAFEELVLGCLSGTHGRIVKSLGDGLLIHFPTPTAALGAAIAIVAAAPQAGLLPVHVGLAAGPVLSRDGDIFGTTVNRASRLAARAEAGTILADQSVRDMATPGPGYWRALDLEPLKGLPDTAGFQWQPSERLTT